VAFTVDPEIAAIIAAAAGHMPAVDRPAPGDIDAMRAATNGSLPLVFARFPAAPDVAVENLVMETDDGALIRMLWCGKRHEIDGPVVLYVHGGGMICGNVEAFEPLTRYYAQRTGIPIVSIEYRLAPEHRVSGLSNDVFQALLWLKSNAAEFRIDPARIALMGDSGGGGIAAAAAIRARDAGIELARQILIYPMLDDRNVVPDPLLIETAGWTYEDNRTAWSAVLGDDVGAKDVSPYYAPARLTDFVGLAPAYIEVGELDIFRDECLSYTRELHNAGTSCELHVHPGASHGFDLVSCTTGLFRRAMDLRIRVIASL
jgi:acetyl esterase/lipase